MARDIEDESHRCERGEKRGAAVAYEWERKTGKGKNGKHCADIKECGDGDEERETRSSERTECIRRFRCDHEAARGECKEEYDEENGADESELLRVYGEYRIVHRFRQ